MEPTSPPTQVDEWELLSDLSKIHQQWKSLEDILGNAESFQEVRPDVSQWSVGMHAGHLALGSLFMARMVNECLADPGPTDQAQWAPFTEAIFRKGGFRRGSGQAPEVMRPEPHSPAELLAALHESRQLWNSLTQQADRLEQCRATRKHFAFGDLKPSDWARLCALHGAHHLRIITDIRQIPG